MSGCVERGKGKKEELTFNEDASGQNSCSKRRTKKRGEELEIISKDPARWQTEQ